MFLFITYIDCILKYIELVFGIFKLSSNDYENRSYIERICMEALVGFWFLGSGKFSLEEDGLNDTKFVFRNVLKQMNSFFQFILFLYIRVRRNVFPYWTPSLTSNYVTITV